MIGIKIGNKFKATIKDGDKIYCILNSVSASSNVSHNEFIHANLDVGKFEGGNLEDGITYRIKKRIKRLNERRTKEIIIFLLCYFLDKRAVKNRIKIISYEK